MTYFSSLLGIHTLAFQGSAQHHATQLHAVRSLHCCAVVSVSERTKFSGTINTDEALGFDQNFAVRELELIDETTQAPFAPKWSISRSPLSTSLTQAALASLLRHP